MYRLALALFAAFPVPLLAEPAPAIPQARVAEHVVCSADPAQSYALFLPSGYDPLRRWPVLFCFDPRARGDLPVRLFAEAAERHGFIVAGSHNSRNGPVADNDTAVAAMLRDVSTHYSLDRNRVYAAGFSGGARVATRVGLSGVARGVIACGGGFLDPDHTPERLSFDFCGYAGTVDFNRDELRRIDRDLKGGFVAHHLTIFPGEHSWLPASATEEALAWLEAQHRHAAVRARYRAFARAVLEQRQAALNGAAPPENFLSCSDLAADGGDWIDVAELRRQKRRLAATLPAAPGRGDFERLRECLLNDWQRSAERGPADTALATLARWRRQATDTADPTGAALARRALDGALLRSCAATVRALANGDASAEALRWAQFAQACAPEQPLLAFNLAGVAALAERRAEAIAALRQAVDSGFATAADLCAEAAFAPLAADPDFRALVAPATK
ncbi:MAG TPA: hypothetical protein PK322_03240 [Opitutaceae bacterium]|nr:hypothetical protein [Opitutaceae bacterium]